VNSSRDTWSLFSRIAGLENKSEDSQVIMAEISGVTKDIIDKE
jgi:hypothetical protein